MQIFYVIHLEARDPEPGGQGWRLRGEMYCFYQLLAVSVPVAHGLLPWNRASAFTSPSADADPPASPP